MVVDPAIVRAGDGAQLGSPIFGFQRLDLLGSVRGKPVLQIDAGKRRGKLAQIGRRRTNQAGELAEAPMGRRDRRIGVRQDECQVFRIVAMGFDADRRALDRPRAAALGAAFHRGILDL
jgi:hypothetical protein